MAVLQMLPEMVRPVELLRRIALPELVDVLEMPDALIPILLRRVSWRPAVLCLPAAHELLPAIPARIRLARPVGALVERAVVAGQGGTGPAVAADMEGVLVPLGLVLVLEAISAKATLILFFSFVCAKLLRGFKLARLLGTAVAHEEVRHFSDGDVWNLRSAR